MVWGNKEEILLVTDKTLQKKLRKKREKLQYFLVRGICVKKGRIHAALKKP